MAAAADYETGGSSEPRSAVAAGDTRMVSKSVHLTSADVERSFVVALAKKNSSATNNPFSWLMRLT